MPSFISPVVNCFTGRLFDLTDGGYVAFTSINSDVSDDTYTASLSTNYTEARQTYSLRDFSTSCFDGSRQPSNTMIGLIPNDSRLLMYFIQ